MYCEIKFYTDMWQEIKDSALFTIHKDNGKYPSETWKKLILLAEHSPIRNGNIIVDLYDVPTFAIGHLVRHNVGFTPFVPTLRKDRTNSEEIPNRETPNNLRFNGNFQAFINISRKRLCSCASAEIREAWAMVRDVISTVEPVLASCMVKECVYRGFCPEMKSCGYCETKKYIEEVSEYRRKEVKMDKIVIITNGSGGVGKDEFANCVNNRIKTFKYSSINMVKHMVSPYMDVKNKTEEVRKILCDVKFALGELVFKELQEVYKDFMAGHFNCDILIIDIREIPEIIKAKKEFNAITVLVTNKNVEPIKSNDADANVSNYLYDYTIANDGNLADLQNSVDEFLEEVKIYDPKSPNNCY